MLNIVIISILVLLPLLSAVAGRAHGSGGTNPDGSPTGWPTWDRLASTLWVGAMMGIGNYVLYDSVLASILFAGLSIAAFSTGHGRVYNMGGVVKPSAKPEKLEKLFGWLWQGPIDKPAYSWFIMGLKGLFIGVAVAPLGILMFFLWPLSYYLSVKLFRDTAPAEWASCGFLGFLVAIALAIKLLGV